MRNERREKRLKRKKFFFCNSSYIGCFVIGILSSLRFIKKASWSFHFFFTLLFVICCCRIFIAEAVLQVFLFRDNIFAVISLKKFFRVFSVISFLEIAFTA